MNKPIRPIPFGKRLFDILFALVVLVLSSPVMLVLALLLWIGQGWPVFFTQVRPGLNGKLFKLVKFRTMRDAYDSNGSALPDEQRITPVGRFMRRTSLDELPEFFNG